MIIYRMKQSCFPQQYGNQRVLRSILLMSPIVKPILLKSISNSDRLGDYERFLKSLILNICGYSGSQRFRNSVIAALKSKYLLLVVVNHKTTSS